MASAPRPIPVSPRTLRMDTSEHGLAKSSIPEDGQPNSPFNNVNSPQHPARLSPTISRTYDPSDPDVVERQRAMDADFAMQLLARARSASFAVAHVPSTQDLPTPPIRTALDPEDEEERSYFPTTHVDHVSGMGSGSETPAPYHLSGGIDPSLMMNQAHEPDLLVTSVSSKLRNQSPLACDHERTHEETQSQSPPFESPHTAAQPELEHRIGGGYYRSKFDFGVMEEFAKEERQRLGITRNTDWTKGSTRRKPTRNTETTVIHEESAARSAEGLPSETTVGQGHRRESETLLQPRKTGGKLAQFESATATLPPFDLPPAASPMLGPTLPPANGISPTDQPVDLPPLANSWEHETRPYRFSFYSNNLRSTIHARTLSELPAENQSFEELFQGKRTAPAKQGVASQDPSLVNLPMDVVSAKRDSGIPGRGTTWKEDEDANSWWLDILCATDEEMRVLSKCFGIHPLTAEDIQMEETREKIELFRDYYLVCFRSFDQNQYSPTYLEPINYYIVVFREGILSFHFRQSPHPQNVRRRIKQLKDYISVTSDWISYALIDDITDAFGPLIQSIEYEVDSIDELVLILREAEQSDMLRRIGTCRKKVMGLLRLMGNKADVVKGLAKRCNENWSMAPKSDIGLYLSDIQDHLITMTQSLNHYEKLLSRSHSNYLAQISIEMTDANNQINDVLSRLTAMGTILIPMNLITGLWGMNVHVPGQDVKTGYAWFIGIICFLVGIGGVGSWGAYRLMRRSRKR
ncbi:related to MNR2-Manganese resistance protein [Serendipita indica DSM 11827]|uniref:Related to MNR2-Manganese resistance protein n=1 Tax=Serendipita indica (strain DSM 11827) TaxID=1109443 RepID=G4TFY8_SERID|nr:related to MNR2-Manganese resistance protein [Serendipita indica DSM 11827]